METREIAEFTDLPDFEGVTAMSAKTDIV